MLGMFVVTHENLQLDLLGRDASTALRVASLLAAPLSMTVSDWVARAATVALLATAGSSPLRGSE
jgi:hypothetical protein